MAAGGYKTSVRVACVQLPMRAAQDRDAFYAPIEKFVAIAAGYGCDFVVFPEMMTFPLLTLHGRYLDPDAAIDALSAETADFVERMRGFATANGIHVVAGSHLTRNEDGNRRNISYLCLKDGSVHAQEKLHPTPDEAAVWGIEGGDRLDVVETDCGPVGTLICYDSEIPELARKLADGEARLIFVPFQTDLRTGTMRVRLCSQARAIENQCYMALAGSCDTLGGVVNMDINYGWSVIFTPCDIPFTPDGIASQAEPNCEQIIFADLDMARLDWARRDGAVRNLRDRRPDLYDVVWKGRA